MPVSLETKEWLYYSAHLTYLTGFRRTFRDWWINEYMISNETLFHRNPATGEKQPIGLGWLDDSMQLIGPTEEDKNYIADTCGDATLPKCEQELQSQVDAYEASKLALIEKVCSGVFDGNGSFWGGATGMLRIFGPPSPPTPHASAERLI